MLPYPFQRGARTFGLGCLLITFVATTVCNGSPSPDRVASGAQVSNSSPPSMPNAGDTKAASGPPVVDDVMWQDPFLPLPTWVPQFSEELVPFWLEALARPEAETRRIAAGTLVIAAQRSVPGLHQAVEPLRAILTTDDDPVVRRAAANALVAIDAREVAADFAAAAFDDGVLMAEITEPALARWGHASLRGEWITRLTDPRCEPALRRLAVEALATVQATEAVEPLLGSVTNDAAPLSERLRSAKACGMITADGLSETAVAMAARRLQPRHVGPLLAVLLLSRHDDATAIRLLTTLAADAEPAVATAAIDRLRTIDNCLALPLAGQAIVSSDAGLRRVGVEVLIAHGDADAIDALCPLLDDRNPGIRGCVAASFIRFAADDMLKSRVIEGSMSILLGHSWRGLEQASLVLGTLDHEPAADRLLELIEHERPETAVAVAWALRKLSVQKTLGPLLAFSEAAHQKMTGPGAPRYVGLQLSQIFQFFGETFYLPAEPLMRQFVPKSRLLAEARGAACWALGHLRASDPDPQLAEDFAERLADVAPPDPETTIVRTMSALSIGRMRSEQELPTLREFAEDHGPVDTVGLSCLWAIQEITGEQMETVETLTYSLGGWFLQPQFR